MGFIFNLKVGKESYNKRTAQVIDLVAKILNQSPFLSRQFRNFVYEKLIKVVVFYGWQIKIRSMFAGVPGPISLA